MSKMLGSCPGPATRILTGVNNEWNVGDSPRTCYRFLSRSKQPTAVLCFVNAWALQLYDVTPMKKTCQQGFHKFVRAIAACDQVFSGSRMETYPKNILQRHPALITKPFGNIEIGFWAGACRMLTKTFEAYVKNWRAPAAMADLLLCNGGADQAASIIIL